MNHCIFRKEYRQRTRKDSGIFSLTITVFFMMTYLFCPYRVFSEDILQQQFQLSRLLKTKMPISSIDVKNVYPHDTGAFTQGLFFHQRCFYESTGLNGKSTLARKEVMTGKSLQEVKISHKYFGEGIALLKGNIYQLTWQNETVLIYDVRSFQKIREIKYRGEGWGLTSDGKHLLMSDGSPTITFRDPDSFKVVRKIRVRDGDTPVGHLNELEFIKGEIWANIFTEDMIVRISPENGKVTGWINLSALRSYLPRNETVDVLNGIAYDVNTDRIFVTGKYWPKIFEIQLSN
jgi:glutamine cyclotransferase